MEDREVIEFGLENYQDNFIHPNMNHEIPEHYQDHEFEHEEDIRSQHIGSEINTLNSPNLETNNKDEYIKSYHSFNKLYGISFQNNNSTLRLAVSSLETCNSNKIEIIELDRKNEKLISTCSEEVEFPCSKIMWSPSENNNTVLASTSDILRLYKYSDISGKLNQVCALNKKQGVGNGGPLTSMDWNRQNPSIIGVCSIDTTVTIWDLTKNEVKTLLIAHDKEVYDMCFGQDENVFISTGADGSVRLFDIRSLDTCSVLFESQDNSPITRVAWNLNNPNFVAALGLDKNLIYVIDQRMANSPYAFLNYHTNVVNAISWAPKSNAYLCSAGDDKNAYIWDIQLIANKSDDPVMSFNAGFEIENLSWSYTHDEWIGITGGNYLQILRVK
jgi:WD repeat-containing protein 68